MPGTNGVKKIEAKMHHHGKYQKTILTALILVLLIHTGCKKGEETEVHIQRMNPEIAEASAEFKANPHFRSEPAKKLVPQLKIGMTTQEVQELLGKACEIRQLDDGSYYWFYSLSLSLFIEVEFDSNGKVQKIVACAPGLGESGSYILEKPKRQGKDDG